MLLLPVQLTRPGVADPAILGHLVILHGMPTFTSVRNPGPRESNWPTLPSGMDCVASPNGWNGRGARAQRRRPALRRRAGTRGRATARSARAHLTSGRMSCTIHPARRGRTPRCNSAPSHCPARALPATRARQALSATCTCQPMNGVRTTLVISTTHVCLPQLHVMSRNEKRTIVAVNRRAIKLGETMSPRTFSHAGRSHCVVF